MPIEATFGWEPLREVFQEPNLRDLIIEQWLEFSHIPDKVPCIDVPAMLAAEDAGAFKAWIVRVEGQVAGWIQFQIVRSYAYRDSAFAFDIGWFLDPQIRDSAIALKLWRSAETALREIGVTAVRAHYNSKHPLEPFFRRLGYAPVGVMVQKVL